MKLEAQIQMGNASFEGFPQAELARILRHAADRLENHWNQGEYYMKLVDINGNTVGKLEMTNDVWGIKI